MMHEFCYNCQIRQKQTIRFDGKNVGSGRFIEVDYCKDLDKVLTPEIKDVAFQLNCKYRMVIET